MLDLERIIVRFFLVSNVFMFALSLVNGFFIHYVAIAGFVIGWCLCAIGVMVITDIVSEHNFRCMIEEYKKVCKEMKENGTEELQSRGEHNTTNDNK